MKNAFRSGAVVSILLGGMLCSCGKKEQPATAEAPAAAKAKPQEPTPPAAAVPAPATAAAPAPAAKPAETTPTAVPASAMAIADEREFTGTVGGQPIMMGLAFDNATGGRTTVKGWYYLESSGSGNKLPLSGTLQDGTLALDQSVDGKVTGSFELSPAGAGQKKNFLGAWKGLGRVLPVKINER